MGSNKSQFKDTVAPGSPSDETVFTKIRVNIEVSTQKTMGKFNKKSRIYGTSDLSDLSIYLSDKSASNVQKIGTFEADLSI